MLKAIIIDDEKECRAILQHYIEAYSSNIEVIAEAQDVASGVQAILQNQPNLVFLDISMPDGTGFDLLERLKPIDFEVIFATAHNEFAIKAFKYSAIDYLLKPITPSDFVQAIKKLKQHPALAVNQRLDILLENFRQPQTAQLEKLTLPTNDGLYFVRLSDIVRCESSSNYTIFHLSDKQKIMVAKTIKEYASLLETSHFC